MGPINFYHMINDQFLSNPHQFYLLIVPSFSGWYESLLLLLYTALSSIVSELIPQLGCLFAAIKLHFALLNGILHAPISYFDRTPTGRILSRFSKDLDVLDTTFPTLLGEILYCALEVIYSHINHLSLSLTIYQQFLGQWRHFIVDNDIYFWMILFWIVCAHETIYTKSFQLIEILKADPLELIYDRFWLNIFMEITLGVFELLLHVHSSIAVWTTDKSQTAWV